MMFCQGELTKVWHSNFQIFVLLKIENKSMPQPDRRLPRLCGRPLIQLEGNIIHTPTNQNTQHGRLDTQTDN